MKTERQKKEIPGTDGRYWIFSNGEVHGPRGKLKPTLMKIGYLSVTISFGAEKQTREYVHKLVARNFISEVKKGFVVNHIDGNKLNNSIENLEIVTRKKNASEWVKSKPRVNPRQGIVSDFCYLGHKYKLTKKNNKYCLECRKLSSEEKFKLQGVDIADFTPIKNAASYMVSKDGRVVGLEYSKLLKAGVNHPGYKYYNIKHNDDTRKNKAAHRLVYEHFVSDIPDGVSVDHIDGNKFNNNVENLRLISPAENIKQWQEKRRNEGTYGFKYNECFIAQAKWLIKNKYCSQTESARRLSISQSYANILFHDRKWKHVLPIKPSEEIIKVFKKKSLSETERNSMFYKTPPLKTNRSLRNK